ncbi:MAG: CynX/NimT family MFS transporter [Thermomicrobiales bacterium]
MKMAEKSTPIIAVSAQGQRGDARRLNALRAAGIILIALNLRSAITGVGPLIGTIRADTGISNTVAGLLTSLPLLAFGFGSTLMPLLARRLGIEWTLFGSLVVLIAGILLRSAPSIVALFVGTAVLGLAITVGNVLLPSLIKRDFPGHIGLMTGAYTCSMGVLAAVASGVSVPLSRLAWLGWRGALGCWAVLVLVAVVAWLPQLRSQRPSAAPLPPREAHSRLWRSPLAWQVTLFMGLQSFLFYVIIAWLPTIVRERGVSASQAGWLLFLMQIVSLPASLVVPMLAGRLPDQRGYTAAAVLFTAAGLAGILLAGTVALLLWVALLGLGLGASISLALMFMGLRTRDAHQAAELSGMAQSIGYLLAATGPIFVGFLHDLTHSWTLPLALLCLVACALLVAGLGASRAAHVSRE